MKSYSSETSFSNIYTYTSTETLKERQRENFWIMRHETLTPLGLNQDIS